MRKNRCLRSFANIVSQFLTPGVWKKANQAWHAQHSPSRWRLQTIVWVLLAMAWGTGNSVEERFVTAQAAYVAHHLRARRPGQSLAGFMHALERLPMPVLRSLSRSVSEQFAARFFDAVRVGDWIPFACDGTRLACPRSQELQERMGQAGLESGPPMVYLTALVLLPLGLPWKWHFGKGDADERQHLKSMLGGLPTNSLLVLDSLYATYELYQELQKTGRRFLTRVSKRSTFYALDDDRRTRPEQLRRLRDRLVYYWPGKAEANKKPIILRLLRVCGKKGDVWLTTNIVDSKQLSRKMAAQVYRWRWRNEGLFRQYKCMLGKVKLSSRSVPLVHREAEGSMLALQLLLGHAATKTTVLATSGPRRTLLTIRGAIHAALCRLGPRQLANYQMHLATVRDQQRLKRLSSRVRQIWPRKHEKNPPQSPQLQTMTRDLKARRDKVYRAA